MLYSQLLLCNKPPPNSVAWNRSQPTFCVKGQIVSVLGFVDHAVYVTTTQFCHGGVRAATGGAGSSATSLMGTEIGIPSNLHTMKVSSFDLFLTIWKCTNYS